MSDLPTRCTTPIARLSYPALFKQADVLNEGDTPKFQCELIFSKNDDISELRRMVANALKNKFGGNKPPANLKMPFRDGDTERVDDNGDVRDGYENSIFVCPRSSDRPGVVQGRMREVVTSPNDVYGGCWVRVSVTAYYYEKGKLSRGVALALNHVWKIRDGEPFTKRVSAEEEFEGVDMDDSEFDEESYGHDYDDGGGSGSSSDSPGSSLI